jgi:hypothetical protein
LEGGGGGGKVFFLIYKMAELCIPVGLTIVDN